VLVGGLGEADLRGGGEDTLAIGDDGVGGAEFNTTTILLLEVLETDLQVQLPGTGDNVLTRLLNRALYQGIALAQALEAFHKLGQV
jgi:hypothetical protein